MDPMITAYLVALIISAVAGISWLIIARDEVKWKNVLTGVFWIVTPIFNVVSAVAAVIAISAVIVVSIADALDKFQLYHRINEFLNSPVFRKKR